MTIRPAQASDLPGVRSLLAAAHLPHEDLTAESMRHFLVLLDGSALVGAVGLEIYGEAALLRSLVVAEGARAHGHGLALVAQIEAFARQSGVTSLYLLTTTAQKFFSARGYRTIDRQGAPSSIVGTTEFAALCPSTAALMLKLLTPRDDSQGNAGVPAA